MEVNIWQFVITCINTFLIVGLLFWAFWHKNKIRDYPSRSNDWWIQIMCTFYYFSAATSEFPAFLSRVIAYYDLKIYLPQILYVLTTWDRWQHVITYMIVMVITYSVTVKKVPEFVKHIQ